jgi:hypothetical protein
MEEALLVFDDAPPVAGQRPGAEPDLRNDEVRAPEAAVPHGDLPSLVARTIRG